MYVFVEHESIQKSVESTSHPTEKGLPITSTIQKQPIELSIDGRIVDNDKYKATATNTKLEELLNSGSLITYKGRISASNMQIQSYSSDYDNKTWGGFTFTMTLRQVRIAKSSYTPKKQTVTKQKQAKKTSPKLVVGAIVVFKGGNVYVSSDATKAAAKRGRSTCKITKINTASWAKHPYHLISTDGGKVYGWVDKANIEGVASSSTGNKENGGTQQTNNGVSVAVYHIVKKGDTVWALVNRTYKYLGKTCQWVIDNNPHAFSRKGDARTLQIGRKLLMGYKNGSNSTSSSSSSNRSTGSSAKKLGAKKSNVKGNTTNVEK